MSSSEKSTQSNLPGGVMLNAYPDSIGAKLADIVTMLRKPELQDAFSLFYILPTFFNSDLDRGFSVIDYDINPSLVSTEDLAALQALNIELKFDLVLNHLSVGSPQFRHLLEFGDQSENRHFFIDWNEFWQSHAEKVEDGLVIPKQECLQQLFMRKPGLPVLKVRFPDGTDRPYWNTFYQEISYQPIEASQLAAIDGLNEQQAAEIVERVNEAIAAGHAPDSIELGPYTRHQAAVVEVVESNRRYLGQMDLNARSDAVWRFYEETLRKLADYGARLVRLDAFAYLHKAPCMTNFFNKPGTWEYLARLKRMADALGLILVPEIHSEYGYGLHEEVAAKGFPIYDFFLPGLLIDALDNGRNDYLLRWIGDIRKQGISTINMLGCHDGIPVLDLKGKEVLGISKAGLLDDAQVDQVVDAILSRGGRVKNLYGPDGKKISYYQVNATFFSAVGEDERKLLLARAIQMFMPGIPQVWYLDLFAGTNDYAAADNGGTAGHKEINRTTLSLADIDAGLQRPIVRDQLELMRLRNTSMAFSGELRVADTESHQLELLWQNERNTARLVADLRGLQFSIEISDDRNGQYCRTYS